MSEACLFEIRMFVVWFACFAGRAKLAAAVVVLLLKE
jgi:hypothetical protein